MKYKNKKEMGRYGERLAAEYLEKEGYIIIRMNFECLSGEVDIIAQKDEEITFVEVKTRAQNFFGAPAEAVDRLKQNHIYKVAEYYLYKNDLYDYKVSFDVVEVHLLEDEKYRIEHMKNAFIEKPRVTYNR